jgi:hypothetical protein
MKMVKCRDDLLASLEAWELNLNEYRQIQRDYKERGDTQGVMFSQGFIDIAIEGLQSTKRALETTI